MSKNTNVNVGAVTLSRSNENEKNNEINTNDDNEPNDDAQGSSHAETSNNEPNDIQEEYVNMPNGPNVDIGNVNTNTLLCTLLSQNAMLMEKSQHDDRSGLE